jgi:hypothetical protein
LYFVQKVVSVFVRFSCAASSLVLRHPSLSESFICARARPDSFSRFAFSQRLVAPILFRTFSVVRAAEDDSLNRLSCCSVKSIFSRLYKTYLQQDYKTKRDRRTKTYRVAYHRSIIFCMYPIRLLVHGDEKLVSLNFRGVV